MARVLAGALRHTIQVQAKSRTSDGMGGYVETWVTTHTARAQKLEHGGHERFLAQQVIGDNTVDFRIRYRAGITTAHRVLYDGAAYGIRAVVDHDGLKRVLVITCVRQDGSDGS